MASSLKQKGEFSTGVRAMMVNCLPRTVSMGASASALAWYTAPTLLGSPDTRSRYMSTSTSSNAAASASPESRFTTEPTCELPNSTSLKKPPASKSMSELSRPNSSTMPLEGTLKPDVDVADTNENDPPLIPSME